MVISQRIWGVIFATAGALLLLMQIELLLKVVSVIAGILLLARGFSLLSPGSSYYTQYIINRFYRF